MAIEDIEKALEPYRTAAQAASSQKAGARNPAMQAALLEKAKREKARRSKTNMTEQTMSGVNEGIAGIFGAPVDLMTGAINAGKEGLNALIGTDFQPIENPIGGSDTFRDILAPTISEIQPQNAAQRFGRRVGTEVGAMAVPGGIMLRGAKAPLAVAGGEVASALGSGIAGQASREIAPESDTADLVASLLGGMSPVAASRAMRPSPKAPTLDELQAQSSAGYEAVRESGATLSPKSSDALAAGIESAFGTRPATRRMNPKAAIAAEELAGDMRQRPPSIAEVDEARQWIGDNVAGSNEAGERRLGMMMKDAIDNHLDQLQPGDVTGTNRANEVVAALTGAREKSRRVHKSQLFEAEDTGLVAKGLRRAATTGTGGNEINAIRQNVRRVLENPKLRRGFNETELQAMRDIADGTPTQNALRLIGRLAPTSGALPLGGFTGAAGAAGATGNPLFIAPAIAGQAAKYLGERGARKKIAALGELIRNGKPLPKKAVNDLERSVIAALLAQKAVMPAYGSEGEQSAVVRALSGTSVE
ncbi:hypothetical protein [Sulfitobacter sp. M22]|jgi:hypothetical protein|uniref:hypothetical protein n=1 Tax=Sulfitobacter sp. M22 TaxID=2675332 RepID=UPI001F23BAB8|nr:hypothetical protein [Sulfitobacter sp. M22]MCF7725312.1 hypothetical protein [Sulfitobacter sp. M22]